MALTIAVELTRTAYGEEGLAQVLLVRAELALRAAVGELLGLRVSERKLILAAAAVRARRVAAEAERHRVAVRLELERALLQLLVVRVAPSAELDIARPRRGGPKTKNGEEGEKERRGEQHRRQHGGGCGGGRGRDGLRNQRMEAG